MKIKTITVIFILFSLILLTACQSEFSCEDNNGRWIDESCIKATSDAGLVCNDNSECEGYCYTVKHPRALSDDAINGFTPTGVCSTHQMPITCANSIETGQIIELCRLN